MVWVFCLKEIMKKKIRESFRNEVFKRDKYKCVICGSSGNLDAHHIINRNEIVSGGYVKENGITLCEEVCHIKAEQFHITKGESWVDRFHPNDLFKLINSRYDIANKKASEL